MTASGTKPYEIGALKECNQLGITTGCITCNEFSPLVLTANHLILIVVCPEFVTGSSRMKAVLFRS